MIIFAGLTVSVLLSFNSGFLLTSTSMQPLFVNPSLIPVVCYGTGYMARFDSEQAGRTAALGYRHWHGRGFPLTSAGTRSDSLSAASTKPHSTFAIRGRPSLPWHAEPLEAVVSPS